MSTNLDVRALKPFHKFTSEYHFSPEAVDAFNIASSETHPLHSDPNFPSLRGRGRIISGLHLWKPVNQLFHREFQPHFIAAHQEAYFPKPVREGSTVLIVLTCWQVISANELTLAICVRKEAQEFMRGTISAKRLLKV